MIAMIAPVGAVSIRELPRIRRHPRRPWHQGRNSPIVVDHVHFEHKNLRAGWANVHAYVNGQLVSGQLRIVRKPEPIPSQPDVSAITDVFNDAIDEV